jgi:YidC/Oxa1 family membrane protein insertase
VIVASVPIFTSLEHALRHVLNFLHDNVGLPWAWSIVALTVLVRILIVPLTVRQIHSMQNLQRHAPQMKEIQRKYRDDKRKQQEELMKFYRENNINPAASCLPLLAQFPIFIALYYVLRNFAHCAKASSHCAHPPTGSLSWLHVVPSIADRTTAHWSGYLLLVIYAASQLASTFFMSTTMDKTQRTILLIMPIFFLFVIARFPTGLVLYWVTTNLWTVGQGLITRRLVPRTPPPAPRRSSRTPPRGETPAKPDGAKPAAEAKPAPARPAQPRKVKKKKKKSKR